MNPRPLAYIFALFALLCVVTHNLGRSPLAEQDKAFSQMDSLIGTLDLDKQQKAIFNQAISANNAVGAAYGEAAYRLGLRDGIRLSSELKEIK